MNYTDILQDKLLHLPITQTGNSFRESLKKALTVYLEAVKTLPDNLSLNVEELGPIDGTFIKNVQQKFIAGLVKTIEIYHEGKPANAFSKLSDTMNNELKDFTQILKIKTYPADDSFFRMRIQKGNKLLSSREMFHIPFELRGRVATQRFSIPRFPCLYLGRTLYGYWEEMNHPDINEFQVVRLKNIQSIKYLDLTLELN